MPAPSRIEPKQRSPLSEVAFWVGHVTLLIICVFVVWFVVEYYLGN